MEQTTTQGFSLERILADVVRIFENKGQHMPRKDAFANGCSRILWVVGTLLRIHQTLLDSHHVTFQDHHVTDIWYCDGCVMNPPAPSQFILKLQGDTSGSAPRVQHTLSSGEKLTVDLNQPQYGHVYLRVQCETANFFVDLDAVQFGYDEQPYFVQEITEASEECVEGESFPVLRFICERGKPYILLETGRTHFLHNWKTFQEGMLPSGCGERKDLLAVVQSLAGSYWQTKVCGSCHVPSAKFKCAKCPMPYCNRACQIADWPMHKAYCGKKQA